VLFVEFLPYRAGESAHPLIVIKFRAT